MKIISYKNSHIIFNIIGIKFSFKCGTYYTYTDSHHVFNIYGLKISIRHSSKTEVALKHLNQKLESISHKLSLKNDITICQNVRFYVPNYPSDYIQREIVEKNKFYEEEILKYLDSFIPDNSIIFDIGANIGNHSLYWATKRNAQKIYAFEPIAETFETLNKNIEINSMQNIISTFNIGLSDKKTNAEINCYNYDNIGGTSLKQAEVGTMGIKLDALDNLHLNPERIDFMKIDVEGHEIKMLKGATEIIKKYQPKIFIESAGTNYNKVKEMFEALGYYLESSLIHSNYLYIPISNAKQTSRINAEQLVL